MGFWGTLICALIFDVGWIGLAVNLVVHENVMRMRTDWFREGREGLPEFLVAGCVLLTPVAVTMYMLGPWIH